jgi:hypothetical protein
VLFVLGYLRLWLGRLRRDQQDVRTRAWATVEQLSDTTDGLLLNGLMVGLLEGHWPRRDKRLWGPLTRALWDDIQTPP